jgi:hypothetical protein
MRRKRTAADDEADLLRIMEYLRAHPHQTCEEAEIKRETGVAKGRVRRLVRGVPSIDPGKLEKGMLCYNPPSAPSATAGVRR